MSRKRDFRPCGLLAVTVFGGFVVMTATGLVLFITPPGRVAYWTDWTLLGIEKAGWNAVHIVFGPLFVLAGLLHLFFNWKPFKHYLVNKLTGHLRPRSEGVIAAAPGDEMKAVAADQDDMAPIELLKVMLDAKP